MARDTETQAVDTEDVADGEIVGGAELVALDRLPHELRQYLETAVDLSEEDPEEVQRRIAEKILSAEDVADVLKPQTTIPWGEHPGKPFMVNDFRYRSSSFGEGAGVYAVVDAFDGVSGEMVTLTTGSYNALVQLYKLRKLGALPAALRLVPIEGQTARGFRPFYLASAGA